jgi:hypothetical protein
VTLAVPGEGPYSRKGALFTAPCPIRVKALSVVGNLAMQDPAIGAVADAQGAEGVPAAGRHAHGVVATPLPAPAARNDGRARRVVQPPSYLRHFTSLGAVLSTGAGGITLHGEDLNTDDPLEGNADRVRTLTVAHINKAQEYFHQVQGTFRFPRVANKAKHNKLPASVKATEDERLHELQIQFAVELERVIDESAPAMKEHYHLNADKRSGHLLNLA